MKSTKTARLLLLSGVATAALTGSAWALEAQAFVDRASEVYKVVGYDITFGEATLDGDTITVDGATVGIIAGEGVIEPMEFDAELVFSGVEEREDGSYFAQSLTIPDIDADFAGEEDAQGHITLSDIRADGLYLPAGDTVPTEALLQLVGSISTGPLSITRNGDEVISIDSMEAASTFNPEQGSTELVDLRSTLDIAGIWLDLSTVPEEDPAAGAVIEALGLTEIRGDITQDMTWTMADGRMVVDEFLFDFADIGALNITADMSGITPEVLDQIYAMQASMATDAAGATGEQTEEQIQAQAMQGMALMQDVNVVGASIRYDDAGLADKAIDFGAEQAGVDRAGYTEGLKATLPQILAGSGVPALNDVVVPAVSDFLDDPQSLEVSVAPAEPTSLLVLAAAAANPAGLIEALGLAVESNTAAE